MLLFILHMAYLNTFLYVTIANNFSKEKWEKSCVVQF